MTRRIVVIGGGIAGLSAAYHLAKIKKEKDFAFKVTLVESSTSLGGVIKSQTEDGYVVEHGPDAFVVDKPWAQDLALEIGLGPRLIRPVKTGARAFVAWNGRLHPLPRGFSMIAPTQFWPFFKSSLFSPLGKLRGAAEFFLPRGGVRDTDESVAGFIRRRFGNELFERVGQAIVGGIYTADAGSLSAQAALPRFVECERQYGSVIRGLRRQKDDGAAGGVRYNLFQTLDKGMSGLVEALAKSLPEEEILLSTNVLAVERGSGSFWRVLNSDGQVLEADAVVVATSAKQAASLLSGPDAALSAALSSIECASSLVFNFLFRSDQITCPVDCLGFVVPALERRNILAVSFISQKFANRAPAGMIMVRVFMGGALMPELMQLEDDALGELALSDLRKYLNLNGLPLRTWLKRWPRSMPQYQLGHARRVAQIEAQVRKLGCLALAGNCYQGVGIPDCVNSGELAAKSVLESLHQRGLF